MKASINPGTQQATRTIRHFRQRPTASSDETDEVLLKLAGTQTDAEIEAIISSSAPRAELFDPIANEVLAAVVVGNPWLVS